MSTATLETKELSREQVRDAVRKITTIATLPEVVAKIVATVEDPKSSAAQLHRIVSHDPALVTRILKVVNSAFYGLPGQIGSIERAIVLLGLNAVKNIAVAASLGQLFRGVKLCEGYTARDLWTHCIAVAVTARDLARAVRLPIADEAFLAGMIHDVGLLIAMQLHPEKLRLVCERAKANATAAAAGGSVGGSESHFCAIERELTGMDHQVLGQTLCELWKFPKSCQVVAGNHHVQTIMGDEHRQLLTLVHVADTLVANTPNTGFPFTAHAQQIDDAMLGELGVDQALIERTQQRIPELLTSASMLL